MSVFESDIVTSTDEENLCPHEVRAIGARHVPVDRFSSRRKGYCAIFNDGQ